MREKIAVGKSGPLATGETPLCVCVCLHFACVEFGHCVCASHATSPFMFIRICKCSIQTGLLLCLDEGHSTDMSARVTTKIEAGTDELGVRLDPSLLSMLFLGHFLIF